MLFVYAYSLYKTEILHWHTTSHNLLEELQYHFCALVSMIATVIMDHESAIENYYYYFYWYKNYVEVYANEMVLKKALIHCFFSLKAMDCYKHGLQKCKSNLCFNVFHCRARSCLFMFYKYFFWQSFSTSVHSWVITTSCEYRRIKRWVFNLKIIACIHLYNLHNISRSGSSSLVGIKGWARIKNP